MVEDAAKSISAWGSTGQSVQVRLSNQFDEPRFIKVASEQEMPAPSNNVEHQASGVIRSSEVPAWRRMDHRDLR